MNLNVIKREVESKIGDSVQIVVYGMRNKTSTYFGKLKEVYPNIFTISTDIGEKSFSYADVCTGEVKIKYF